MYSYDDEPICACSTPAGISGIAVIRVSGNGCGKLADKCSVILRSSGDYSRLSELPGYTCAFGYVKDPSTGARVDEVIFTRFEAPHSYTGEEMIEISSHGSGAVKQEILKCLGMSGIRMAYPGEFSRRAFINGKMSLASAEAVMDVINSETERQLEAAGSLLSGKLADEIDHIEKNLYDPDVFDFESVTGLDLTMTKAEMLDYGFSAMNHAMVIVGVDLEDGKPLKWKIENSWGEASGSKGYHVMSDTWFERFVYQAVIKTKYLTKEQVSANKKTPIHLDPWDPMGTLAD